MKNAVLIRDSVAKPVECSLTILEIMAQQNSALSLNKISQLSGLSIKTTQRLLNTLCETGFIELDQKSESYKLTLKAFLISTIATNG